MRYDPMQVPDPKQRLGCDESERIDAVLCYHQRIKYSFGNQNLHATVHTIVENQLATGLTEVCAALVRLQAEGLDRHEAVHAIGLVLSIHLSSVSRGQTFDETRYDRDLRDLDLETWRQLAEEEPR